jgi:hypothetical protein
MQSWKFNSTANSILRTAVATSLRIPFTDVYKVIRETKSNYIILKTGKVYKVTLEEI